MDTQPKLTTDLVVLAIHGGMLDEGIEAIRASASERREVLSLRKAGQLNKGDRFLIKDCRPLKWNGVEVEFTHHDGQWLVVNVVEVYDQRVLGKSVRLRTTHVGTITKSGV